LLSKGLVTTSLPTERILRNLDDAIVEVLEPSLAANEAKGVYKKEMLHEETQMVDDGSVEEDACE